MIIFFLAVKDIRLIQISFDGNNSRNPPNLIEGDIFERVQYEVKLKTGFCINSCIDVIYKDAYEFIQCEINQTAAITLELSSSHF